jgi:hypothetical protein
VLAARAVRHVDLPARYRQRRERGHVVHAGAVPPREEGAPARGRAGGRHGAHVRVADGHGDLARRRRGGHGALALPARAEAGHHAARGGQGAREDPRADGGLADGGGGGRRAPPVARGAVAPAPHRPGATLDGARVLVAGADGNLPRRHRRWRCRLAVRVVAPAHDAAAGVRHDAHVVAAGAQRRRARLRRVGARALRGGGRRDEHRQQCSQRAQRDARAARAGGRPAHSGGHVHASESDGTFLRRSRSCRVAEWDDHAPAVPPIQDGQCFDRCFSYNDAAAYAAAAGRRWFAFEFYFRGRAPPAGR